MIGMAAVCTENLILIDYGTESPNAIIALLCFFLTLFASPFKSKSRLEAENAALRHRLIVLQRRVSGRVQLTNGDRLFFVMLYRCFPSIPKAITIIRPETPIPIRRAISRIGTPQRTSTEELRAPGAWWFSLRPSGSLL